jgi:arginyl-tRNA synthetase
MDSASARRSVFADLPPGYLHSEANGFHNYHFTAANHTLPFLDKAPADPVVLEGFAPNLNKHLHVGHLKNLAAAVALSRILKPCQPVALLGASLGVLPGALSELHAWFDFVGYHPQITLDTDLPHGLVPTTPGSGKYAGCQVWHGPLGSVVVIKSDGRPTYAYHDLAYARVVKPDWYVTGCEQAGHFASLGLADKHLPMGLVLGPDGTKLSSSAGGALLAEEARDLVLAQLEPTPEPRKLAWNILTFTFLKSALATNTKFDPVQMTRPTAPGMYLTYTLAKVHSALLKGGVPPATLTDGDVVLLGLAAYAEFYLHKAAEARDPARLANYLLTLARGLACVYGKQSIKDGPAGFQYAVSKAFRTLEEGMATLGLFPLHAV